MALGKSHAGSYGTGGDGVRSLKRFGRCLVLTLRPLVGKNWLLFLLILLQMTMLFHSIDRGVSGALMQFDYISSFFDLTEERFVALSLNTGNANRVMDSASSMQLWREISAACGETPLVAMEGGNVIGEGVQPESILYSPELFGIRRPVSEGRWLTAEDAGTFGCVVSADLASAYPLGSTVTCRMLAGDWGQGEDGGWLMDTREYRVVGVLASGEVPLTGSYQDGSFSMSSMLDAGHNQGFIIFPAQFNRYFAGVTMWFRTDRPAEELQERLSSFGTVITQEDLVGRYRANALKAVFADTPYMSATLVISLLLVICIMVLSFGGNRRYWSVLYLLGQSRRMMAGCIAVVYSAAILLAFGLYRIWLAVPELNWEAAYGGVLPSISVAHWTVIGLAAVSVLCINGAVLLFFRHSPMTLFTENK